MPHFASAVARSVWVAFITTFSLESKEPTGSRCAPEIIYFIDMKNLLRSLLLLSCCVVPVVSQAQVVVAVNPHYHHHHRHYYHHHYYYHHHHYYHHY